MHKMRLNKLCLEGKIIPRGPLLIKSGVEAGADPTLPRMNFVRTLHPQTGETTIYLPGSSLKGAIRSHAERLIRTRYPDASQMCCDPLGSMSCDKRIGRANQGENRQQALQPYEEYQRLCLACRIFGHTIHAGHFTATDAYPDKAIAELPLRQGVAINRFSGSAKTNALFDMEVTMQGAFQVRFTLVNFELWQVGLLALVWRDLRDERLPIGFGKSRGLGRVTFRPTHMEVTYPGHFNTTPDILFGIAALNPALIQQYNLFCTQEDKVSVPAGTLDEESLTWLHPTVTWDEEETIWAVLKTAVMRWTTLSGKPTPV